MKRKKSPLWGDFFIVEKHCRWGFIFKKIGYNQIKTKVEDEAKVKTLFSLINKMRKITFAALGAGMLFGVLFLPVLAKATDSPQELIQQLQQQIEQLKTQIEAAKAKIEELRQANSEIKSTTEDIKETLKLVKRLRYGMTSEDVKLLQEILATDPDIYPERLVTGYFGSLTEKAVKKFQKAAGIEQVGEVGPKTIAKINELLKEGAGKSGKVPPGLLIAPGIRAKLGFTPVPPPGQELPPGIKRKIEGQEDSVPPVISGVSVIGITSTSAKITWTTDEKADSKVWYDKTTPLVVTGSTPTQSSSDLVLKHNIGLFDLTPGTAYYYAISSTDSSGNTTSMSVNDGFNTLSQ